MLKNILSFKGTWRTYQKRVLDNFDKYRLDGKVHIVAAPGSGKTTVGIEFIKRFNEKALILAPSIAIREQWVARIKDAFLRDGLNGDAYFSQDIKNPKLITVSTYQSIHSAMTKYKGFEKDECEDAEDSVAVEEVDFSSFDIVAEVKNQGIKTICLDECHHLRNEWWKALENFNKEVCFKNTVALTATPPYDSTPDLWNRYISVCGETDEEITVAELVKEGSLCPHQDYVYFNFPTSEEHAQINNYKRNAEHLLQNLMADESFARAVFSFKHIDNPDMLDSLLEKADYFTSVVLFFREKGVPYPKQYDRLLLLNQISSMNLKYMEALLQGMLYENTDDFSMEKPYYEKLLSDVKATGVIDKRKVYLTKSKKLEAQIVKSTGKCESIKDITFHEYEEMGDKLRLLILTDYIKKDFAKYIGNSENVTMQIGVLPFFEMLRRENEVRRLNLRFGILCGTLIVIPSSAKPRLLELSGDSRITFSKIGHLSEDEYVEVKTVGDSHFVIALIGKLYEEGYFQCLIGTKSLLGEGWDAPCVNTLILASFVGSFMLSNQMRGRAIRTFKSDPEKVSHIWHLVCVNPENMTESEDMNTLIRRMDHFLGLHYEENTIENGIKRLTPLNKILSQTNINIINKEMFESSKDRTSLKKRWQDALAVFDKIEVVDETAVKKDCISGVLLFDAIRRAIIINLIVLVCVKITMSAGLSGALIPLLFVYTVTMIVSCCTIYKFSSPLGRLKFLGNGIRKALLDKKYMQFTNTKVVVEEANGYFGVYLKGGTTKEKERFAKCTREFFGVINNQRYLFIHRKKMLSLQGYFAVPDLFGKNKEDAEHFAGCIKKFVRPYKLVYTRNAEGRRLLFKARLHTFANAEERFLRKQKAINC